MKKRLIRNMVRCKNCGEVIESKHTYDRQTCKCGAVSVDGGLDYDRVIGERENYEPLQRWLEFEEKPKSF